jgi:1-acyl-sn-glycerol-3-phosphate acyltransferase
MDRILYYSDEINDDFANTNIVKKPLKANYAYFNKGFFGALKKFIIYRCFLTPVAFFYNKIIKRVTYKNKKVLKGYKNRGCFIYGNHTAYTLDAFNPTYISYPRTADIVVNSDAVSIPFISGIVKAGGALPIPDKIHDMPKFASAVAEAIDKKHWVAIYPEAHIWPYYTKIRNFSAVSFNYPVRLRAPVFVYTMVYKKRKHSSRPKRVVYVDGPFFPDATLPTKEAVKKLRNEAYTAMCERAKLSDCEYVEYVYQPKEQ